MNSCLGTPTNPIEQQNKGEWQMINLIKHGYIHEQKIKVNHGKTSYWKREKYCVKHGWIDLFLFGGELQWQAVHSKCDRQEITHNLDTIKEAA